MICFDTPGDGLDADFIRYLYQRWSRVGVRTFSAAPWPGQHWRWVWRHVQRCMIPSTFGYIHCTLVLVISFTLIVTLNHAAERDTSSEHSLAPPKRDWSSSCTLDMKCGQANVGQHVSVRSIMLPREKGFTGHYLIVVLCLLRLAAL